MKRVPLGRLKMTPLVVNCLQYVPVGQGELVSPGWQDPRTSASSRRHCPVRPSSEFGTQDQFSGHITRAGGPVNEASSHGSTTHAAPFATLKEAGWGRHARRHAGRVPSAEVADAGVASAVHVAPNGPGWEQLADNDRARLDGLHRAPISAGVRVSKTMARILPPPIEVFENGTCRHLRRLYRTHGSVWLSPRSFAHSTAPIDRSELSRSEPFANLAVKVACCGPCDVTSSSRRTRRIHTLLPVSLQKVSLQGHPCAAQGAPGLASRTPPCRRSDALVSPDGHQVPTKQNAPPVGARRCILAG
jgi:hypothetical protein